MTRQWRVYPPIDLAAPVLALAAGPGGLWAGGLGGVAWYAAEGGWQPRISGLPVTSVSALAWAGGWLFAGGAGGIARSRDRGQSWLLSAVEGDVGAVTTLAPSPTFAEDTTALAATLGAGVLRTTDAGQTWKPATFGLESAEVSALLWPRGEQVLAATADGIYRSSNGGRAWRVCAGSDGAPIAGLAALPDGSLLGAVELGGVLRSGDGGLHWERHGDLPPAIQATALIAAADVVLLGSAEHGLLRTTDAGATWNLVADEMALAFAVDRDRLVAGTGAAVLQSVDAGATWQALPSPPLHGLQRLSILGGEPLVSGTYVPPVRHTAGGWTPLQATPLPLTAQAIAPDGAWLASGPQGLSRSLDGGESWRTCLAGPAGAVAHITFRPDGTGWAGSADGRRLIHTRDGGSNWAALPAPFGVLPLVALQATPALLMAATYDPRRQVAQLWRSEDHGATWKRGVEARTAWPVVAMLPDPPMLTLGSTLFFEQATGEWAQVRLSGEGVRRLAIAGGALLALTTAGIMRSDDGGQTWARDDTGLPVAQIMDIAVQERTLYVLLAGGEVWSGEL